MKATILVADDEPSVRQLVEAILTREGYHLEFATNGKEAVEMASRVNPDLILLDIMMPDMHGMEVCETLRKDKRLAEVPIVMVTALDDQNTRIASIEAGVDDYITKPFVHAELRARVRSIIRLNRYRRSYEKSMLTSWIVDNSKDGYLELDANDMILYANSRARFYLGLELDLDAQIPDTFMNIVNKQYNIQPADAWKGWPSSGTSRSNALYLVRPESDSAHEFWLEITTFELTEDKGNIRRRVVRMHDVTAAIRIDRNTRSFGEAIAHKIRTPITQMIASLDLLSRHITRLSQDEAVKFSETALKGANRLKDTLNQVLSYSNLRVNVSRKEGLKVSELHDLIQKVSGEVGLQDVQVSIDESLEDSYTFIPVQSLEVVFWELFENSKNFHPQKTPTVKIDIAKGKSQNILLRVGDNGMSLSPRQLSIAFLPYYQGEKDFTGEAPGMGLGLSTVSSIIWSAGGACRITNQLKGPGVVVELVIPEIREEDIRLEFIGELNARD